MTQSSIVIAVDALGINQPGGARTAVLCLFRALVQLRPDWQFVILLSQREAALEIFANVRQIVISAHKGLWARALVQAVMPFVVWRYGAHLVHFTKSQGGVVWGAKVVLTLFDLTTLRYPAIHAPSAVWYWRYIQPLMARWSDAIVTLSENAAHDLQQLMNIAMEKVTIVPCAPQFEVSAVDADDPRLANLPETYLLFVGAVALKKNLATLIYALNYLRQRMAQPPTLILVGPRYSRSDASAVFDLISHLELTPFVHYLGEVDEQLLPGLYQRATIFVMPSMHEGFGIPCLEAMACGTPVLASHASALPEVIGEAGVLVNEFLSPEAWAMHIEQLLADPAWRTELSTRGRQRAQQFTWQESAQILAHLYEQLLTSS